MKTAHSLLALSLAFLAASTSLAAPSQEYHHLQKRGWGWLDKIVDTVVDVFEDTVEAVVDVYEDSKDYVEDKVDDAVDKVVDVYEDSKDFVEDKVDDVVDKVVDVYEDSKDFVEDKVDDVVDKVVDVYDDVKDNVVDAYDDVKDTVVDVYDDVKDNVVDVYDDVKDKVVDVYDEVEDFVDDAVDVVTDVSLQVISVVEDYVDKVVSFSKEFVDDLKKDAKATIAKVYAAAETKFLDFVQWNFDISGEMWETFFSVFDDTFLEGACDFLLELRVRAYNFMFENLMELYQDMKDAWELLYDLATANFDEVVEDLLMLINSEATMMMCAPICEGAVELILYAFIANASKIVAKYGAPLLCDYLCAAALSVLEDVAAQVYETAQV